MKLTFHGAAQTVTGSCHELRSGKSRILLDCGLFQGSRSLEALNHEPLPFDVASLDAVVLSHAHIDHSGQLPRLSAGGYRGPIWCTEETAELLQFIGANVSGETFFVSSDIHASVIAPVVVDLFSEPVAMDFVTGSVAAFTFEEQLANVAAQLGVPAEVVVEGLHLFMFLGGVQCRNLATDSFGRVDVDPVAGTVQIELKGADGLPVLNTDPLDPGNMSACTWTVGP